MRPSAVISEAARNLTAGTTHAAILALVAAAVLIVLVWTEISTINRITQAAEDYQRSGASVQVLYSPGGVNPEACEALNDIDGIRAAGAVRDTTTELSAAVTPQSKITVKDITQGIATLLDVEGTSTREGLLASQQVADALTLTPGDTLPTTTGDQYIQGIYQYPDDGRMPGYGYAIMNPVVAEGLFDACWADIWPENPDTTTLLWTALDSRADTKDNPPTIGQLNTSRGKSFDGATDFETRITKHNGIVAFAVLFALSFLAVRTRRLELASALHTGVNKSAQIGQLLIETATWTIAAALLTAPAMVLGIFDALPTDRSALLITSVRIVTLGVAATMLGTACATILTREKHLFRYFKER